MKYPFLQLYVSDYLSDPALSLCSAATRGVWIDFLCVMHMADRCGVITGTREQLARLGRCSTVEVAIAIDELNSTKAADVTERNSVVTLINRRMKREYDARKKGSERVRRFRETSDVTQEETQKPLLVIECSSGSPSKEGESRGEDANLGANSVLMIYEAYPRKVAKPEALRAIAKALRKTSCATLLGKTRAFAAACIGQDPQFIPHPATWFNQERFNDDPETWKRNANHRPNNQPNNRNASISGNAAERTQRILETIKRREAANGQ